MKVVYLAWRDPKNRSFPVGRLSFDGQVYRFVYTKGVKQSPNFIPFARMEDLATIYESDELFPLFANRVLSKKRLEYQDFLHRLNIRPGEDDPLTLLGRTGGIRATDLLAVFPCPEKGADKKYRMHFSVMPFAICCLKLFRESISSLRENNSTSLPRARPTEPIRSVCGCVANR